MALPRVNDEWAGVDIEAMKADYLARVDRGERLEMHRQANYDDNPYEAHLPPKREYVDTTYSINGEAVPREVFEAVLQTCQEYTREGKGGWQWRLKES